MTYPNIFDADTLEQNKARLDSLLCVAQPLWGQMDVAKMLAHLNRSYQIAQGKINVEIHPVLMFFLKNFVKKSVVGNRPYAKNGRTASYFLVTDEKDFETEKQELIKNMLWVFEKGADYFEGRATGSFGKLTAKQWSNLFQKHLDHHFNQFGI